MPQPDCEGKACFYLSFITSDPKAESWKLLGRQPFFDWELDMPKPDDPQYNFPHYPQMRDGFKIEAEKEMAEFKNHGSDCCTDCHCEFPKDAKLEEYDYRYPVTYTYTYPGPKNQQAEVYGSFRVQSTKMNGTCFRGRRIAKHFDKIPDEVYAFLETLETRPGDNA